MGNSNTSPDARVNPEWVQAALDIWERIAPPQVHHQPPHPSMLRTAYLGEITLDEWEQAMTLAYNTKGVPPKQALRYASGVLRRMAHDHEIYAKGYDDGWHDGSIYLTSFPEAYERLRIKYGKSDEESAL